MGFFSALKHQLWRWAEEAAPWGLALPGGAGSTWHQCCHCSEQALETLNEEVSVLLHPAVPQSCAKAAHSDTYTHSSSHFLITL